MAATSGANIFLNKSIAVVRLLQVAASACRAVGTALVACIGVLALCKIKSCEMKIKIFVHLMRLGAEFYKSLFIFVKCFSLRFNFHCRKYPKETTLITAKTHIS